MGPELIPDGRAVQLRATRSRMFMVDPQLTATNPASPGWRVGRKYLLEQTLNEYKPEPVRQVNLYVSGQLIERSALNQLTMGIATLVDQALALTLCEPDGKFIVHRMPLIAFTSRVVPANVFSPLVGERIWWQRFFDRDTLPDPRQSYIESFNANSFDLGTVGLEFVHG